MNNKNKSKMEKKQSSIEWFAMILAEQGLLITKDYENLIAYKEAKAMHKEEIEEAYMVGNHSEMRGGRAILEVTEKYYEQTFGDGNND